MGFSPFEHKKKNNNIILIFKADEKKWSGKNLLGGAAGARMYSGNEWQTMDETAQRAEAGYRKLVSKFNYGK